MDLFDPRHYADVRRPLAEAASLPAWCYTSPAFLEREVERLFLRQWLFVGRADEAPAPGDFFAVETPAGPVAILRGRDGVLRAFANTCRHRGSRLLAGRGSVRAIVCPYHAWTYDLEGRLAGAPGMDGVARFDRGSQSLVPVRIDQWGGFVFIALSDAAGTLTAQLGDLPTKFAAYRFDEMVCTRRTGYDVACNWKLLLENALEAYHTGVVHGGSLRQQIALDEPTTGDWHAIFIARDQSIAVLPDEIPPFPQVPELPGRLARGSFFTAIHPNTQFACTQDCMWWLNLWPRGPEACRLEVGTCFPRTTVQAPDFALKAARYYHRWDVSIAEDNAIGAVQQAGLRSTLRPPGRYSLREFAVHRMNNWLLDRVLDPR
ncbi:MAG: aromatic ring-hydroxylating dioxygenase subunit alpha [Alphaproteobacteria bacterium]|nr:aromatic ring-hydroxylating dioxygenase subunit alpha [Alphaproteobacteria bacterium]